jgi:hypothetical protein
VCPVEVRVYVGQTLLAALYTALAKKSPGMLRSLHVPQRMVSLLRALRKQKTSVSKRMKSGKAGKTSVARRTYNSAIAEGKNRDEAIAAARRSNSY